MSRIDELIKKRSKEEVQIKPLWELTIWDKKFNSVDRSCQTKINPHNYLLAAELRSLEVEGGNVKLLTTSISEIYTTEGLAGDNLKEGEIVSIPWGGNAIVQYYKGKYVTADNRIATSVDTSILDNKFLYYLLSNRQDEIASFYRGSGIKHPDMSKVLNMQIPVPPLEVQREIVRVMDHFTLLSAELSAELKARKKQYEYYREELLKFDSDADIYEIGEICTLSAGGDVPKDALSGAQTEEYPIPIISNGIGEKGFYGYTNTARVNEPCVTVAARGAGVGHVTYRDYPFFPIIRLVSVIPNEKINPKFLYYTMQRLKFEPTQGGIPQLTVPMISKYKISVPSMDKQMKIVNVLDNFESICSDLSIGLPAEIEARQKQYEYYRDKLLSFKEA